MITIGRYTIKVVEAGEFRLDGGAMFGVVPRVLWSERIEPDEKNRIRLSLNLLLVEGEGRKILVDTGTGERFSPKAREIYGIKPSGRDLRGALRNAGVPPDEITDVVLTHLHFDHAGGIAYSGEGGDLKMSLPGALHHIQKAQWRHARNPSLKDKSSFRGEDFKLLEGSSRLKLHEGTYDLAPGVRIAPLQGHTPGMQMVIIGEGGGELVYASDLIPTSHHLKPHWLMAYDLEPMKTMEEKEELLEKALGGELILVFEHDKEVRAGRVRKQGGKLEIDRVAGFSSRNDHPVSGPDS